MSRSPNEHVWRIQQLEVVNRTTADVDAILRQTRIDINNQLKRLSSKDNVSAAVRRQQIMAIKKVVADQQAKLWRDVGDLIKARRLDAASRIIALGAEFDRALFRSIAGIKVSDATVSAIIKSEELSAKSALDRMLARVYGQSYVTLSQRVYTSSVNIGKVLDNKINSALARGLSAKEFAREIQGFIDPSTPGGLRYAAMRLARTEINNAAHAMAVASAQGKPWIESMQWQLSASHKKQDVCDDLAEGGISGDGTYAVNQVPGKPHPHCYCIVVPVSVSDEAFLLNLASGGYDDYAARYLSAA